MASPKSNGKQYWHARCACGEAEGTLRQVNGHRANKKTPECAQEPTVIAQAPPPGFVLPGDRRAAQAAPPPPADEPQQEHRGGPPPLESLPAYPGGPPTDEWAADLLQQLRGRDLRAGEDTTPPLATGRSGARPNPTQPVPTGLTEIPDPPTFTVTCRFTYLLWMYYDVARHGGYEGSFDEFVEQAALKHLRRLVRPRMESVVAPAA